MSAYILRWLNSKKPTIPKFKKLTFQNAGKNAEQQKL